MSRYFSKKFDKLTPYTPGEQPRDLDYIKLNTNESPFPPSSLAVRYAEAAARQSELYPDPKCTVLNKKLGELFNKDPECILCSNGSDEILNFAFSAFCDNGTPAVFADITYGFYPVFAEYNNVPFREIPLKSDFTIDIADYFNARGTVFIANPNAPTGIALSRGDIEQIIINNPDNVVVVDEAYVDFGGESCVDLTGKYDNLLVTQTFSKSRSMAGARLGFGVGCRGLINDLNTIKYSTNPYNINRMTAAAALGALEDEEYTKENCKTIIENRGYLSCELEKLGFAVIPSQANFVFAKHPELSGGSVYEELKKRGVLIRHFDKDRIRDYNRITVGTRDECDILLKRLREIL